MLLINKIVYFSPGIIIHISVLFQSCCQLLSWWPNCHKYHTLKVLKAAITTSQYAMVEWGEERKCYLQLMSITGDWVK